MNNELKSANSAKSGLDWPTLILILFTGGANLLGTHQGTTVLSAEQQEALGKIRELHKSIDDFEGRQKEELDGIRNALKNQEIMLKNQQELLKQAR